MSAWESVKDNLPNASEFVFQTSLIGLSSFQIHVCILWTHAHVTHTQTSGPLGHNRTNTPSLFFLCLLCVCGFFLFLLILFIYFLAFPTFSRQEGKRQMSSMRSTSFCRSMNSTPQNSSFFSPAHYHREFSLLCWKHCSRPCFRLSLISCTWSSQYSWCLCVRHSFCVTVWNVSWK